jgi:DNA helicase-2/ATP-dependent DNA helicase PcrA
VVLTDLCALYNAKNSLRGNARVTYWDCGFYFDYNGCIKTSLTTDKHQHIDNILRLYFAHLSKNSQIDFELVLYYSYEILGSNQSICTVLSKIFSFILIDEYQDTKNIQYHILSLVIRANHDSIKTFIVGDPNQAIYQSLGGFAISAVDFGTLSNITFNEMSLSKNYRSSALIVNYFSNYKVHDTDIESFSTHKDYQSLITFNNDVPKVNLEDEIINIIQFNIKEKGISPDEICVIAPWWVQLAAMTRKLVSRMPEYTFNGPGTVPFASDIENVWYILSKIILTEPSPHMYLKRLRWASEVVADIELSGVNIAGLNNKRLLKECNSISIDELDGLTYLRKFIEILFKNININFRLHISLTEQYESFFESSEKKVKKLIDETPSYSGEIDSFRKVFKPRNGITISTIHGVKGTEYDTVIAFAILEGMVPHFSDRTHGQDNAKKMLYVIGSRARKNLHIISERQRTSSNGNVYVPTIQLTKCNFEYNVHKFQK